MPFFKTLAIATITRLTRFFLLFLFFDGAWYRWCEIASLPQVHDAPGQPFSRLSSNQAQKRQVEEKEEKEEEEKEVEKEKEEEEKNHLFKNSFAQKFIKTGGVGETDN